jgi:hypothetical protein
MDEHEVHARKDRADGGTVLDDCANFLPLGASIATIRDMCLDGPSVRVISEPLELQPAPAPWPVPEPCEPEREAEPANSS